MAKNKLLVQFPGVDYSCDKPLLYYAAQVFDNRGYEIKKIKYKTRFNIKTDNLNDFIEENRAYVLEQLIDIDFKKYEDVVFLSKSIGTAIAGYFEVYLKILVRHIYLTPVKEALKYFQRGKCIVVSGKNDKILDSKKLKIYCIEQDVALKQFEEVGHSLENRQDINKTFAILMVIIRLYKEF